METKIVCYHDSDIIFRERLDEKLLSDTDYWYFSDTRNYVAASYLKRFGDDFFVNLCTSVHISHELVDRNESNSGGAQHIMKGVTSAYWEQVEEDSEIIYSFIKDHNSKLQGHEKQAQAWCADMWAVLWNAWKMNKEVRLHDELLFSWPKDHISRYNELKIFHNSGVFIEDKNDFFCKLLFKKISPYGIDFSKIKKEYCSSKFVELINKQSEIQKKITISDFTLIICLSRGLCVSSKEIEVYVNYILKYLQIPIHVVEMGNYFRIDVNRINSKAKCFLNKTDDIGMHIKKKINTPFFVYVDANILLPIENIIATVDLLLTNDRAFVFPMNIIFDMNPFEYNLFMDTLHGYFGLICATVFGQTVPKFSFRFVPI